MNNTNPLVRLPALRGSASSAPSPCRCGCGVLVPRSYAPGHDARLAAFVRRVLVGQLDLSWIKTNAGVGVHDAVVRELKARTLPHIEWTAFDAVERREARAKARKVKVTEPAKTDEEAAG